MANPVSPSQQPPAYAGDHMEFDPFKMARKLDDVNDGESSETLTSPARKKRLVESTNDYNPYGKIGKSTLDFVSRVGEDASGAATPPHHELNQKISCTMEANNLGDDHFLGSMIVYFDLETTGTGTDAEICQIGAYFDDNEFTKFVCPQGEFHWRAAEITKLSKKDGVLHLHDQPIETVSLLEAWKHFLDFLGTAKKNVVLVIHNRPFDSRLLLRDLSTLDLMERFRNICVGMVDTLSLCREIFPERKKVGKGHRLEELVRDKLGEDIASGSHNALNDAKNLQKLMKLGQVTSDVLAKHYRPLSEIERAQHVTKKAKILRCKIPTLSREMAKKIVGADISYEDLILTYSNGGEAAIEALFCGTADGGKPKVTKSRKVVAAVIKALSHQGNEP